MSRSALLLVALVAGPLAALEELPVPALDAFEAAASAHLQAARRDFESVLAGDPSPEALAASYGAMGMVYYGYELHELAAVAWANAVELRPEEGRWLYLLGLLKRIEGEWDEAEELLRRATLADPENVAARIHRGRLLLDQADIERAENEFQAIWERHPTSAAAALGLARTALAQQRHDEAILWGRRALALEPRANVAHHQIGLAYRALGDLELARRHFALAGPRDVSIPDPLTDGLAEIVQGASIQAKHGVEAARNGRLELAIRYFRRAVELAPAEASHRYNLAVSLRENGQAEAAIGELERLIERFPEHRDGHFNLAALRAQAGDAAAAASHYQRALEIDPSDRVARIEWAASIAHLGQVDRATAELQALVAENEDDAESRLAFATVLLQQGLAARAHAVLSAGLERDVSAAEWADLAHLRAQLALEAGDLAQAEREFEEILAQRPEFAASRLALGRLLARSARYDEAVEHFQQLVAVEPANAEYQLSLALALRLGGDDRRLVAVLEEATVMVPQSIELHHLLAQALARSSAGELRDPQRALLLAQRVMEAEPTVDHGETVAEAFAATGDYGAAVSWQQRVVDERARAGDAARAMASAERLETYQAALKGDLAPGDAPGGDGPESAGQGGER